MKDRLRHIFMPVFICILLAAPAKAVDFKISGEWLVGFGAGSGELYNHYRSQRHGPKEQTNTNDIFEGNQQFKLKLDASVSENLSGTVFIEIGDQHWGQQSQGGALGADSAKVIKLKNAYIDFALPNSSLSVRMGLQNVKMPSAAGSTAVQNADVAAIVANYKINDMLGLTGVWMRPLNDNFTSPYFTRSDDSAHYLDNMDLFSLSIPLTLDGLEITPWLMYGMMGKNALRGLASVNNNAPWQTNDGVLGMTLPGLFKGMNFVNNTPLNSLATGKAWIDMFWVGLPLKISLWEPLSLELDFNYGQFGEMGRFDIIKRGDPADVVRGSTRRAGWLVKALLEYKMDWMVPGVFGWYASGDDGNVKNGSERFPSLTSTANFTSFVAAGNVDWGSFADSCDWDKAYSGTWGIGLQLRDISFIEDLSHTLRAAWWGGTNSPAMVKYMENAFSWRQGYGSDGPYLTTNDGLLEFNFINKYKMYENLELNFELGYVVNFIDQKTWQKSSYYNGQGNGNFEKQDAWKSQLTFIYSF